MLALGNFIPDFTAPDQDGNIVSSAELLGKKTVVYPVFRNGTPILAILRDNVKQLRHLGFLIGV